jgi:hypothetical protein
MSAIDAFDAARQVCESLCGLSDDEKIKAIRMALVFLAIDGNSVSAAKADSWLIESLKVDRL